MSINRLLMSSLDELCQHYRNIFVFTYEVICIFNIYIANFLSNDKKCNNFSRRAPGNIKMPNTLFIRV